MDPDTTNQTQTPAVTDQPVPPVQEPAGTTVPPAPIIPEPQPEADVPETPAEPTPTVPPILPTDTTGGSDTGAGVPPVPGV